MLAVVAGGRRRGLGQAGAVNCADFLTWPPNIFNPQCYGITWAKLFGSPAEKAAAYAATSPDVAYPPMAAPRVPQAVTEYGFPQTGAGTLEQAQAASDAAIAAAKAESNQQNVDYFSQVAAGLDTLSKATAPPPFKLSSISPWVWLAVGAGALVLVARRF